MSDSLRSGLSHAGFTCLCLASAAVLRGDDQVRSQELPPLSAAREVGLSRSTMLTDTKPRSATGTSADSLEADLAGFRKHVAPVFARSCVTCHGPETAEGGLRVDTLSPDLLTGKDVDRWLEVFGALSNGEMPPEGEPGLADEVRAKATGWMSRQLEKASVLRRGRGGHSSFRRMTRYEYQYALQDLLGLPYEFAAKLPPEAVSEDGLKNSSETLQMSASQFETYRTIGLEALGKVVVLGERPTPVRYVVSMRDVMDEAADNPKAKFFDRDEGEGTKHARRQHLVDRDTGRGLQSSGLNWNLSPVEGSPESPEPSSAVMVFGANDRLRLNLGNHLPDGGIMRVRVRAGRTTRNPTEYPRLRLVFGAHTSNNANFSETVSERDLPVTASADEPAFVQFDVPLSEIPRNPFRKNKVTFPRRDELLTVQTVSNAGTGRGDEPLRIHVDYVDVTAPHYEEWPPASHTRIFFASENRGDEAKYGREVLTAFMERAWCRPVTPSEVDPFLALLEQYRPQFESFEGAMVEVLATVLATPEFLYLVERRSEESDDETTVGDTEWATRIAFFLWSSLPDEELLQAARQGRLEDPEVLETQVRRMLADPRAERFALHFVEQWLGLEGLESTDHVTDTELKEAMRAEPVAFFREVLRENNSVLDFLHSDYVVVNERLAAHYGLSGVHGPHFRRVDVTPDRHRGGLLTCAAVLAMNSDGEDSHPLKRGVWLLERVLNDPPPPPPPNVPEVDLTDPAILQMTLKERIANHRDKPACSSCHARIDPWGIAFENYDALGSYRTTIAGKPVDATSELFNTQPLAGMDGLKRYLLVSRQDQLVRALVHKTTAYALGRPLSFGDRAEIDQLTREVRQRGDRLQDLVTLVVASRLLRSKRN